MSKETRYKPPKGHYDGKFSIGTHTEDLHDEGGPTDGSTINEITGEMWTDGGLDVIGEVTQLGGYVIDTYSSPEGEEDVLVADSQDHKDLADQWLETHGTTATLHKAGRASEEVA